MSLPLLIALILINSANKSCNSLDSYRKYNGNTHLFFVHSHLRSNTQKTHDSIFNRNGRDGVCGGSRPLFSSAEAKSPRDSAQTPIVSQKYVHVHSRNASKAPKHYGHIFRRKEPSPPPEAPDEEELDADFDGFEDNENFFEQFAENFNEANLQKLNWLHPMPCCVSQMAAMGCVKDLVPPSAIADCFDIRDDSRLEDIISNKLGPYYNTLTYDLFFKYQKDFYFEIDKGEVVKREIQPLRLGKPEDAPEREADRATPSVPLGWRTFAVLGMFDTPNAKEDPAGYWGSTPLTDGDPPPRLASGLFRYGDTYNFIASREAMRPDGTLLYAKDPVLPDEFFRGEKGDIPVIGTEPPPEHKRISRESYRHMIAEDGMWPRQHYERTVGSLALLQALWARLSTTMLRATAKVIKLYRLKTRKLYEKGRRGARAEIFSVENKLDLPEYFRNKKRGPVEATVGTLYFMAAPTLHHAVDLVCSDPMARASLYKNLLVFEADDALRDKMTARRGYDPNNPREYLVLGERRTRAGRYAPKEPVELLGDRVLRFLIRSNCVKSYFELRGPRKDNAADFNMPLEQLLPPRQYLRRMLREPRIRAACLNANSSRPVGDLAIINKFEFDEALEWARRNPFTRAGCYDSLFVTMAHEVGFYGQNAKFLLPVPPSKSSMPHGQEYVTVNKDPVKVLAERMKQHSGHLLTVPPNAGKYAKPRQGSEARTLKSAGERLRITVRKSVDDRFTADSLSRSFAAAVSRETEAEAFARGELAVLGRGAKASLVRCRPCDVQTYPRRPITLEQLVRLLEENAPKELDRPFFARFLRDYVYLSLPEGHLFEPVYSADNRRANEAGENEFNSPVGAEEMMLLDKHRIEPTAGLWAKKRDLYVFKNGDHFLLAPNTAGTDAPMDANALRAMLLRDEVFMDMVRRGGANERLDTSHSYTRHGDTLVSHLTPEEQLKFAYTVDPLSNPRVTFTPNDELPSCRRFEALTELQTDARRTLMRMYPYERYQVQLEFMEKLDRGHASIEDDPLRAILECDPVSGGGGASIATWEEPDRNLLEEPGAAEPDQKH